MNDANATPTETAEAVATIIEAVSEPATPTPDAVDIIEAEASARVDVIEAEAEREQGNAMAHAAAQAMVEQARAGSPEIQERLSACETRIAALEVAMLIQAATPTPPVTIVSAPSQPPPPPTPPSVETPTPPTETVNPDDAADGPRENPETPPQAKAPRFRKL